MTESTHPASPTSSAGLSSSLSLTTQHPCLNVERACVRLLRAANSLYQFTIVKRFLLFWVCDLHTADADATQLSSCVASAACTEFATSSRRLPTDSVDNLETGHSGLTTWILIDIDDNFFNNDVIMSLLVTNLNSSTAQEVVNWVTTGEGCEGFTPPTRTTLESRRRCVLDFSCLYTVLHCKLIHVIRPSFSRNIFSVLVRSGFSTFHGLDVAANSLNFEYKCIFCIFNILLFSLILSLPVTFRTSSYRKLLMFFFQYSLSDPSLERSPPWSFTDFNQCNVKNL